MKRSIQISFIALSFSLALRADCKSLWAEQKAELRELLNASPRQILAFYGATFLTLCATTVAHELGHALIAKLFFGSPINIQIGGRNFEKTAGISFNGFLPMAYAVTNLTVEQYEKFHPLKRVLHYLAGPLAGIVTSLVARRLLKKAPKHLRLAYALPLLDDAFNLLPLKFNAPYLGSVELDGWSAYSNFKNWKHWAPQKHNP